MVIPCIRVLKIEMSSLQERFDCPLVKALKGAVERRLSTYEDKAASHDPRFKLEWYGEEEKTAWKSSLMERITAVCSEKFKGATKHSTLGEQVQICEESTVNHGVDCLQSTISIIKIEQIHDIKFKKLNLFTYFCLCFIYIFAFFISFIPFAVLSVPRDCDVKIQ